MRNSQTKSSATNATQLLIQIASPPRHFARSIWKNAQTQWKMDTRVLVVGNSSKRLTMTRYPVSIWLIQYISHSMYLWCDSATQDLKAHQRVFRLCAHYEPENRDRCTMPKTSGPIVQQCFCNTTACNSGSRVTATLLLLSLSLSGTFLITNYY